MSQWTYKEFSTSSANDVEAKVLAFVRSDLNAYPPVLVKISITDAANEDAYAIVAYYSPPLVSVTMPTIYGGDRWDAADFTTVAGAVGHLNTLDFNESVLAQLTVRKLRDKITWTVITPHGA